MGMKVGDRVALRPQTFGNGVDRPDDHHHTAKAIKPPAPPLPGTVTYCHPSGRWYQVTFDNGIRECFFAAVEPTQIERVPVNRSRLYGSVINDN